MLIGEEMKCSESSPTANKFPPGETKKTDSDDLSLHISNVGPDELS